MSDRKLPPVDELEVVENPELVPEEKETTIHFAKRADRARIHTDEAGITRRLLAHDEAEVKHVVVLEDGVARDAAPEEVGTGATIVGALVSVPVGALQVKARSRKSGQHAKVVSARVKA